MTPVDKLKTKLAELFQLDQADLDFGIYRIMNAKRDEITRFLERDLLPQVEEEFKQYKSSDRVEIQKELDKVIEGVRAAGMDPEQAPKVKELRARYAEESVDMIALQNEVFSHLYDFFARYYDEGDFISLRRYKEGVYAIPYEGEEVKLHWANHDQYYIKTAENFRDYAFRLPDGRRVHFKIAEADTEKDNVKASNGKDRRFILAAENPVAVENDELIIRFEYRPDPDKRKQDALNAEAVQTVVAAGSAAAWTQSLSAKWRRADGSTSEQTVLEKRLSDYTKRNTFDYFIHKDLGRFLRRELDFYIKNEVMHLDDVENESAPRVEQYLSKIRIIRKIAHKLIEFLAQLEDFQKRLWLKKKFVVETNYCVTLDRVPEELYPEIAKNDAQREEWVRLFAIDRIAGDMVSPDYSVPLTVAFLKAHPLLVVDTKHFPSAIRNRILANISDHNDTFAGCLLISENYQAARLAATSYIDRVASFYSDPPFNLGANADFPYKTDYQDSTWLTLLKNRINAARPMLSNNALIFVRCDYHGSHLVRDLLLSLGLAFKAEILIDRSRNEAGSPNKMESTYEHLFMFGATDCPVEKYTVERSLANIKWTGFLMAGDRNPPERVFLGKTIMPPSGQHWSLRQQKVDKLLDEWFLRLKCRKCSCLYYCADDDESLNRAMKAKGNRFKFYDIKTETLFHGRRDVGECAECGGDEYRVEYLGSDEVFVSDNWLDIPSYSRRWGFATENSEELLDRVLRFSEGGVLDLFGGSGTTAAVAMKKSRPWLVAEMGAQAVEVIVPRLKLTLGGESSGVSKVNDWKGGGGFKYCMLESYEDALANLRLKRTDPQQQLLDKSDAFRESYMLRYMLDVETQGSSSLLDLDRFEDPFSYQILVGAGSVGETKPVNVDLVETFNWLLGLKVRHMDAFDGFRVVEGANPKGEKVLVIWRKIRDLAEQDPKKIEQQRLKANEALDAFFKKQQYNTMDMEFDVVYVNGDNNLMNLPMLPEGEGREPRYKVRLIEEEFKRLMFDVKDV